MIFFLRYWLLRYRQFIILYSLVMVKIVEDRCLLAASSFDSIKITQRSLHSLNISGGKRFDRFLLSFAALAFRKWRCVCFLPGRSWVIVIGIATTNLDLSIALFSGDCIVFCNLMVEIGKIWVCLEHKFLLRRSRVTGLFCTIRSRIHLTDWNKSIPNGFWNHFCVRRCWLGQPDHCK